MDVPTEESRKPYKIKDVSRTVKKAMMASSLDEMKQKAREKFEKDELPKILLDQDGTEIDEDEYFQTLEADTELVALFPGEQWADPTQYVTITTRRDSADATDSAECEKIHLQKLVGQLRSNLYSVSVLSEADLELLTNMDPNSVTDITGKDFIEQLKETSGRILFERRQANDAIELLNLIGKNVTFEIHRNMGAEAEAAGCGGDPAAVWVRRAVQQDVQTSGTSGGRLEGGSGSSTTKL